MWPTLLAGTHYVMHAADWLEGGLVMSYEKFAIDADQLLLFQALAGDMDLSENGQALAAIAEVGPGGHFLGCTHTQANFETAFTSSRLADNMTFEQWQAEGARDITHRAARQVADMLASYRPPPLDAAVADALNDYVARAKAAVPDSNV